MSEAAWDFCESDFRDLELHRDMCLIGVSDPEPEERCECRQGTKCAWCLLRDGAL